jgi:hypothetical protein
LISCSPLRGAQPSGRLGRTEPQRALGLAEFVHWGLVFLLASLDALGDSSDLNRSWRSASPSLFHSGLLFRS